MSSGSDSAVTEVAAHASLFGFGGASYVKVTSGMLPSGALEPPVPPDPGEPPPLPPIAEPPPLAPPVAPAPAELPPEPVPENPPFAAPADPSLPP